MSKSEVEGRTSNLYTEIARWNTSDEIDKGRRVSDKLLDDGMLEMTASKRRAIRPVSAALTGLYWLNFVTRYCFAVIQVTRSSFAARHRKVAAGKQTVANENLQAHPGAR